MPRYDDDTRDRDANRGIPPRRPRDEEDTATFDRDTERAMRKIREIIEEDKEEAD